MALEFILGLPGGGKSYMGTRLIIEELSKGVRCIATNLPLDVGRLREYLQQEFGESFKVEERLRVLTPEECGEFWCYRYVGKDIDPTKRKRVRMKHRDFEINEIDYVSQDAISRDGVLFVIDEAHKYFHARNWAKTGTDASYYISQHRHFGDMVLMLTQFLEQVDKTFRELGSKFYYCQNNKLRKIAALGGLFKLPPGLKVLEFDDCKMKGGSTMRFFKIDVKGVASCYDTAGAVGFVGALGDTQQVGKGYPWYVFATVIAVVGITLVIGGKWALLKVLRKNNMAAVNIAASTNNVSTAQAISNAPPKKVAAPRFNNDLLQKRIEDLKPKPIELDEHIKVTGIAIIPRKDGTKAVRVFLSDGRMFTEQDKELEAFGRDAIQIGGKAYAWNRSQATSMPESLSNDRAMMAKSR